MHPSLRWRPLSRAILRGGPAFSRRVEDRKWVQAVDANLGTEYVLARTVQSILATTLRADLPLTPDLSLPLYAQPFVSSGDLRDFKRVADPRARRYVDRFQHVDAESREGGYRAELIGDGTLENFRNPAFGSLQLRSNAVLRGEFRPGSTPYLVWAQSRTGSDPEGEFDVGRNLGDLFSIRPENALMLKLSYWLNP